MKVKLGVPYRIEEIVAHRERMQLLDEMISYDEGHILVGVTIRPDTQFCAPDIGVPAWVGIEYMAQAVGAFSGIEEVQMGKRPQIGLLLGTRRYECAVSDFPVGARLEVRADLQLRDDANLVVFLCSIDMNGQRVARADVKAIRPENVLELIKAQS
jgi:predicted hotdog family 3-hydroxylacyl-ACP dehydratase